MQNKLRADYILLHMCVYTEYNACSIYILRKRENLTYYNIICEI